MQSIFITIVSISALLAFSAGTNVKLVESIDPITDTRFVKITAQANSQHASLVIRCERNITSTGIKILKLNRRDQPNHSDNYCVKTSGFYSRRWIDVLTENRLLLAKDGKKLMILLVLKN